MHTDDLLETVRTEQDTALSRLGSSKSVFADTAGDLEPETVLAAAATRRRRAADCFEAWAAETEGDLAGAFDDAADTLATQVDPLADRLDDFEPGSDPADVAALRDLEGDLERAGGLLGWALVADRKNTQVTGYFTGQADPQTASLFRGFGGDFEDLLASVGSALDDRCEGDRGDQDWEAVEAGATRAVEAAYDDYVETLESMGVNPKPVC